jgi:hypothetical protein
MHVAKDENLEGFQVNWRSHGELYVLQLRLIQPKYLWDYVCQGNRKLEILYIQYSEIF